MLKLPMFLKKFKTGLSDAVENQGRVLFQTWVWALETSLVAQG